MRTATIRSCPAGIELSTPYDADFVDALKTTVPSYARKWVPERKVWTVAHTYVAEVMRLLEQYFTIVDLREEHAKDHTRQRDHEHQTHGSSPYATLHLQPTAPPELITSAYHCLAKLYHPDRGGDLTMMQRINRAYEELKR